jgi:CubicO group peptidase (beta-lactamase class C family)
MLRPPFRLLLLALLLPTPLRADGGDPDRYAFVPDLLERVRERFAVPGIAVAVVEDGELRLATGSGVRELGKPAPVDADTLFAIASLTKGFTAALLSQLADEGKLSLDDRVIDHLPQFQMADPYASRELRLRDLLAHRSGLGLGAGDLLFWPPSERPTADIVARLRHVPPATGLRERYAYANAPYAVLQQVIEKVDGRPFLAAEARVLDRAGMAATRVNADALRADDHNVAIGHAPADFTSLRPVPAMTWANNAAAGGLYSSVRDLATWMRVQLDGGLLGRAADGSEQRLFSATRHAAMWEVVTPIAPRPASVPALQPAVPRFAGYGEGWGIGEYRGEKLVSHTGGWPGMVSRITLVPSRKLGVVVLTNQEQGAAFNAVTYEVLDAALGAPDTDWTAAFAAGVDAARERAAADWAAHQAARRSGTAPALPLAGYAGRYRDAWYGEVELRVEGAGLVMQFAHTPALLGDLEHWQHDSFIVRWRDRTLNADAFASFALDHDGKVRELRMEAISPLTDFSFDFHDLRLQPQAAVP